jgi:trehalose 6-phosphate phosphatase
VTVAANILAARHEAVLQRVAASRVLLAFDFDGTLAPIGADPARVTPRPETSRLLLALARRAPVAVITGRAFADVRERLGPAVSARLAAIVGNHGIEPSSGMARAARLVATWRADLARLNDLPGVVVEDKRYSLSIHYRHAPDAREARREIRRALAALPDSAATVDGHSVANVMPVGAPDKGVALRRLQRAHRLRAALFVGDDVTDEAAFRAVRRPGSLGVRVGRRRSTAAQWFVPSQADVDELLRRLLAGEPATA